jgi:purine-binding chemotaxis protein CheW
MTLDNGNKQHILTATPQTPASANSLALLAFKVAGQAYGLPVASVVRIIEMVTITRLPGAPDIIQGIINLHGKVTPVMDLRQRFGLPGQTYGLHTPIILVDAGDGLHTLGLVVDAVDQVVEAGPDSLEMTETIVPVELAGSMAARAAHLAGIAKVQRQLILVLNVRALLTPVEQARLAEALSSQA